MLVYLLDNQGINVIESWTFPDIINYKHLVNRIEQKFKKLPKKYQIYIDDYNKEIIIDNEEKFKLISSVVFIREIKDNINDLGQSIFQNFYDKLSEEEKEKFDEKYNCVICETLIKNENPLFCYQCQIICHYQCLKDWDSKVKKQNQKLKCPKCNKELPFEKWKKKLYFEDNRINEAIYLEEINKSKLLIGKYKNYIQKTFSIFKYMLNELNQIHTLILPKNGNIIYNLLRNYPLNIDTLEVDEIYKAISEELLILKKNINKIENKKLAIKEEKDFVILDKDVNDLNKFNKDLDIKEKNDTKIKEITINLIYNAGFKTEFNIFGKEFVEKNKNNIDLILFGKRNKLVDKCILNSGDNKVALIIKNKLTNIEKMFYCCNTLKNIDELKYIDTKDITNFSFVFFGCSSLTDISALQKWDVSKGKNFSYMFSSCTSLSNIKPLEKWNLSNGTNFSHMFDELNILPDINPLLNWNVSNGVDFSYMFRSCSKLTKIDALEYWNVSNGENFSYMFSNISYLSRVDALKNWNVSKGKDFSFMFERCQSLFDVSPLKDWNVSNRAQFNSMFKSCHSVMDFNVLKNWKVSDNNFKIIKRIGY